MIVIININIFPPFCILIYLCLTVVRTYHLIVGDTNASQQKLLVL